MAVSTIQQLTQLPHAYYTESSDNLIRIYGAASLVSNKRRSLLVFVTNQTGTLFSVHVFTGQNGGILTAQWFINNHTETLTPRVDGNDIVIDCSGTLLHDAWSNGIAITN